MREGVRAARFLPALVLELHLIVLLSALIKLSERVRISFGTGTFWKSARVERREALQRRPSSPLLARYRLPDLHRLTLIYTISIFHIC